MNLVTVDPRLDFGGDSIVSARNHMNTVVMHEPNYLDYANIGHQGYMTDPDTLGSSSVCNLKPFDWAASSRTSSTLNLWLQCRPRHVGRGLHPRFRHPVLPMPAPTA